MELLIIFTLTLLNGFFSLSEIALVSVKQGRMESLAGKGNRSARIVLELRRNPERFLSAVQVGITLIGIIAGAYGGAALTDDMIGLLSRFHWLGDHVETISLVLVIGGITYFTIVVGELVPKSIALNSPERIALIAAPIIHVFSIIALPIVKVLGLSTSAILKVIGINKDNAETISEDELRSMLRTANLQGVLEQEETQAHQNLFRFTDQNARTLMTHRSELEWLDLDAPIEGSVELVRKSAHSKFPVCRGSLDEVVGVVTVRDLLHPKGRLRHLSQVMYPPIFVPSSAPAFAILNRFKRKKQYAALVIDEHGQLQGMVTLHDLIEAIVGDLPDHDEDVVEEIIEREDGTWLINGQLLIGDLNEKLDRELIEENNGAYSTVAGFILDQLEKIPKAGDKVEGNGFTLEVLDMDGNRIDKVLLTITEAEES